MAQSATYCLENRSQRQLGHVGVAALVSWYLMTGVSAATH